MSRPSKPIQLYIAKGNPNRLTKSEIKRREEDEIKLGAKNMKCPSYVKNDAPAFAKWKEIIKIYKDIDFVSSGDVDLLGMYCMSHSQYLRLMDQQRRIDRFEANYSKLEEYFDAELLEGLDAFFKFGPVMQLEAAINKKMDMLIKMEDRLFLSPLSKVKNIPKKEVKKEDPLANKGFGNV